MAAGGEGAGGRRALRVLVVEDVETDAALLVRELERGFAVHWHRVETPATMAAALLRERWDLVISDYSLPGFGALGALELVKRSGLDLPFIIVSGTVGEDVAVEALHAGAHDFLAKGKLARLLPAIERELRDAAIRAERVRIQDRLFVADRMASVGLLAAGVGHEINNPLAVLMANLEFATQDVRKLEDELRHAGPAAAAAAVGFDQVDATLLELAGIDESLRDARDAAERVRNIVRDLRLFSRADDHQTGAVDLWRVIDSSLRIASNELRHRTRTVRDYLEVPPVEGNEARLGQVILNLVVHAAQAMPEGRADRNEIRIATARLDRHRVEVEIRDNGPGMAAAQLGQLFDPFSAGKPIGAGTGMGLAIAHRLVTAMGGTIAVSSRVGEGTAFRLTLPVAAEAEAEAEGETVATPAVAPDPELAAQGPPRRARILVVDDDPLICSALRRMLAGEHEVRTTTRARDALALVEAGAHFDVVICDVIMPEMSGVELHAALVRLDPAQAAAMVFMTGGAFAPGTREFLDQVRNPRIDKPLDSSALKALIHNLTRQ